MIKLMKKQEGITIVALTITVLLFLLILSTITFTSLSSIQIRQLNNMYADIINLQEKIDLYYLKNGFLPIDVSKKVEYSSDIEWLVDRNPNDGNVYYELDSESFKKLDGITLNNSEDDDKFYINEQSHTIYYSNGIQVEEGTPKIYTMDLSEYQNGEGFTPVIIESNGNGITYNYDGNGFKILNLYQNRLRMSLSKKLEIMKLRYEKCMNSAVFREPLRIIRDKQLTLDSYIKQLEKHIQEKKQQEKTKYVELVSKLDALSPLKTLTRGYSIIERNDKIIKSVKDLNTGDNIKLKLVDGEKQAEIL